MPQWNNPDMIICDRFRALREEKKLYQGDIEKRRRGGSGSHDSSRPESRMVGVILAPSSISETLQIWAAPVNRRGWSEHEKSINYEPILVDTTSLVCSAAAGGRFCALACRTENDHILSGSR